MGTVNFLMVLVTEVVIKCSRLDTYWGFRRANLNQMN